MSKLNIAAVKRQLTESKKGGIPQTDDPADDVKTQGISPKKTSGGEPKKPATKKLGKMSQDAKVSPKKTGGGGDRQKNPGKPGKVEGTSIEKGDAKLKTEQTPKNKKVAAPPSPKSGKDKSIIPDAGNVTYSIPKVPTLGGGDSGSEEKLLGTVLKGLTDEAAKKITLRTTSGPKGGSVVKGGGVLKMNQDLGPKEYKAKDGGLVSEGVIAGTVHVSVGGHRKLTFEAISPLVLNKIVSGYAEVGQPVHIDIMSWSRNVYNDPKFSQKMMEAIHAAHHGLKDVSDKSLKEAFEHFKRVVESEYTPSYYESKKQWINEAVKPAFRQARKQFTKAYESMLRPFEVTVRANTNRGLEDIDAITMALNEDYAAANAIDEVLAECGLQTKVVHAFVGPKKYLPEEVSGVFAKLPKFHSDLPSPSPTANKVKDGSNNVAKPAYKKLQAPGAKKVSYSDGKGKKSVASVKAPSNKGGDANKYVRKGEPPVTKTSTKDLEPKKDGGPIYEDVPSRAKYNLIIQIRDAAAKAKDHKLSNILAVISDKLEYGTPLDKRESRVLDKFIELVRV